MMSNNFIEIKGTVFKRFQPENVFQISCADARERITLWFMMYMVLVRNFSTKIDFDQLLEILPYMAGIIISEYLIDWVKHYFILKFNHITIEKCYREYCTLMANDIVMARIDSSTSHQGEHSAVDQVCRRTSFATIPNAALLIVISIRSLTTIFAGPKQITICAMAFLIFLELKFLSGIMLNGFTEGYHNVAFSMNGKAISRNFDNNVIGNLPDNGPFEQIKRNGKVPEKGDGDYKTYKKS